MCANVRMWCVLMGGRMSFQPLRNCVSYMYMYICNLQRCLSGAHLKYSCEWYEDGS